MGFRSGCERTKSPHSEKPQFPHTAVDFRKQPKKAANISLCVPRQAHMAITECTEARLKLQKKNIYKTSVPIHQKLFTAKVLSALRVFAFPPTPFSWEHPPPSTSGSCRPISPAQPQTPLPSKTFLCSFVPRHRACRSHLCGAAGDPGLGHHPVSPPVTTTFSWSSSPHIGSFTCRIMHVASCPSASEDAAVGLLPLQSSTSVLRCPSRGRASPPAVAWQSPSPGEKPRREDGPGLGLHPLQLHIPALTQSTGSG